MTIFLTGASGYVGSAVAHCLLRAGHRVLGLTRRPEAAEQLRRAGFEPILGDFAKPMSFLNAAQQADVLIHAGFDRGPDASRHDRLAVQSLLAAACRGRARSLIYTSGVWVLGAAGPAAGDERSPARPPKVVEWRPEIERLVLEASTDQLTTVVLRPGCVYGGRRGLFGRILRFLMEERRVRLIHGGRNRWATVYLDDLAELYRLVVEKRPRSAVYHATDGSADTVRRISEALIEQAGGGSIEATSLEDARVELGPIADALAMDQWISSAKTRRELGWTPRVVSAADHARCLLEEWHEADAPLSIV